MKEKELKDLFIKNFLPKFNLLMDDEAWFYHQEFPVRTPDGKKFIDMVLKGKEVFYILEFKRGTIDYGAVEQLHRYLVNFDKQLYCKNKSKGILIGKKFSKFEYEMCEKFNFIPMIFDGKFLDKI